MMMRLDDMACWCGRRSVIMDVNGARCEQHKNSRENSAAFSGNLPSGTEYVGCGVRAYQKENDPERGQKAGI